MRSKRCPRHMLSQPGLVLAMIWAVLWAVPGLAAHADSAVQADAAEATGAAVSIEQDAPGIRITAQGARLDVVASRIKDASGIKVYVAPALRQDTLSADQQGATWGRVLTALFEPYATSVEWADQSADMPAQIWLSAAAGPRLRQPVPSSEKAKVMAEGSEDDGTAGEPELLPWEEVEVTDDFVPPPLDGPIFIPAR